jgi:hypothetical protein
MIPGVHIYIDGIIKEGDKIVRKVRKQKGHSFVKQFAQYLLRNMVNQSITVKDIGNNSRTLSTSYFINANTNAGATITTYGLVIGSNATAVTINDYTLNTQIAHGITAGTLQYSAMAIGAPTSDATSNYFVMTRVFTNGSGGNVSINEIGIYVYDDSSTYCFCFSRDILTSTITLTNGQNLTLNYTIKVTI